MKTAILFAALGTLSVVVDSLTAPILGGIIGGAIRSFVGYKFEAPENEKFMWFKFAKSILWAAITGGGGIYVLVTTGQATFTFWGALFSAAIGGISGDLIRKAASEKIQPSS